MAAARVIPGVCGVFESNSPARTMRTPCVFQSGMYVSVVIRATHVVAAASTEELAFLAFEACGTDRAEEHRVVVRLGCESRTGDFFRLAGIRGWLRLVHL